MAAGEPVRRDNDLFGSTVNLAARICDATDAGFIRVSDVVHDHGVREGFSLRDAGEVSLKGFSEPTPIYELVRAT